MAALRPPFRANDMKSLYNRILKGVYDPLPSYYSMDLSLVINSLLKVSQIANIMIRLTPAKDPTATNYYQILFFKGGTSNKPNQMSSNLNTLSY